MSQPDSSALDEFSRLDRPSRAPSLRHVESIDSPVDRAEVLRYLGYPADVVPHPYTQEILNSAMVAAAALAQPRAVYAVFPVLATTKRLLRLETPGSPTEFQGAIGEFLGPVDWVIAFIATAGPQIERQARQLQAEGDHLGGLIYDAVGSERAEAAEAEVIRVLRSQFAPAGLDLTLPYSPGYCGMALTEQAKLFGLFGGSTAGVTLSSHCLMQPIKSVSGLIGIGPAENVRQHGSPCERCELWNCNMRR